MNSLSGAQPPKNLPWVWVMASWDLHLHSPQHSLPENDVSGRSQTWLAHLRDPARVLAGTGGSGAGPIPWRSCAQ